MTVTRPQLRSSPRRPAPAPERPRHLEVVRGREAPGRRPPTAFVLIAVSATIIALLALVTANVLLGQAGFTQVELQRRVAERQEDVEQLSLEVARLRSPHRIAREARKLGLVPGTNVTFLSGGPPPERGGP